MCQELIIHHKALYYQGRPEINDNDYDKLEDELRVLFPDSPVLNIVGTVPSGQNKVKHLIGHTQFSTSANIYGNKVRRGTDKERAALAEAKAKAIGSNIFSKAIEN